MGVPGAVLASGGSFDSAADALRTASAALDYLNCQCSAGLDGAACGELLIVLGEVRSKLTAAHASLLCRFDAADAHDADGYGSSSAWLTAKAGMSKQAAKSAVRQMRQLGERPLLGDALAAGDVTDSLALTIAGWTAKLPAEMRTETDRILLRAATAGAGLDDLAVIAACAIEKWRQQRPDPDGPDDGFDDRRVQLGSTFGGTAVIRGNLTPECAAAVRAVIEALGKKAGPEDDRDQGKRFHDALQLACTLLLRARLVPQRSGADTQAVVHIPLSQLRRLPGAPELEHAWLRARAGEDAYLTGTGAETASCDAQTVPVVTATLNPDVIDKMIALARAAAEATPPGRSCAGPRGGAGNDGTAQDRDSAGSRESADGSGAPGNRDTARGRGTASDCGSTGNRDATRHGDTVGNRGSAADPGASGQPAGARPGAPGRRGRRRGRGGHCDTRWPGWPSTWSRVRTALPPSCARGCWTSPGTPRASRWTSGTRTASLATSAARYCYGTGGAPGPGAAARPSTATSTT